MSTRYVWEKHTPKYKFKTSTVSSYTYDPPGNNNDAGQLAGYVGRGFTFEENSGQIILNGVSTTNVVVGTHRGIYSDTNCFSPSKGGAEFGAFLRDYGSGGMRAWLSNSYGTQLLLQCFVLSNGQIDPNLPLDFSVNEPDGFAIDASTKAGTVTANTSNAYPTISGGGIQNGFVYLYKGSDNIDPISISYQTAQLRPGDSLAVTVSPGSPTHGGTISYLYQYRVNGGAWTDIQTTTAASINFTIPANAKSIQFRARAQDDMGFTSTTYVTGTAFALERLRAYP